MNTNKDKRIKRATRLNLIADHILAPVLRKQGKLFQIIIKNWSQIAGTASSWALPLAVHFPDGKAGTASNSDDQGVLSIGVTSARAPELQMLSGDIIERANAHFGYLALRHIRINQHLHGHHASRIYDDLDKTADLPPQTDTRQAWHMDEAQRCELENMINTIKDASLRQQLMAMLSTRLSDTKTP